MGVFQNIINTYTPKERATEEKKIQKTLEQTPQLKRQFERVNRAEKKLQEKKGGIDFKSPWSKYFIETEKAKTSEPGAEDFRILDEGEMKREGIRKNAKGMQTTYMPSSAIQRIRYNPKTQNLYITFTSGNKEYLYPNVKEKDIQKYLTADSKGRYNYYKIRPKYAVSKEKALQIKAESHKR